MTDTIQTYQCPACNGPLQYSAATGKLECEYCEEAFACARAGDPIAENFAYAYFLATAGALILALVWVWWDTRSSFSVSRQKKAAAYEVRGSFRLEQHSDMFLNEEVTVKKTDNKSAGSDHESRSGEGGSGGTFGF